MRPAESRGSPNAMAPSSDQRVELTAPLFAGSSAYMDRARQVIVRGVGSALRATSRPIPLVIERAKGSRLIDIDGRSIIDYVGAYGPALLGHNPDPIVQRVADQIGRGILFGAQHAGELELAERIIDMVPSAEMVAFANTGSEAVHAALRIAKVATGRTRILKFEGHYHGWIDPVYLNLPGQPPTRVPTSPLEALPPSQEVVVARWNDLDSLLAAVDDPRSIAAILMEPIPCNAGVFMPEPDYLPRVRELCDQHGIVLIFDEVITGFRLASGGAQQILEVTPDLTVLGKAIGAGFPLAVVAGRAALMSVAADGPLQLVGTYNGNAIGVAAANGVLAEIRERGPALYEQLEQTGARLARSLTELAAAARCPLQINQIGSILQLLWAPKLPVRTYDDVAAANPGPVEALAEQLLLRGIYSRPRGLWYVSAAHTDEDLGLTIEAAQHALEHAAQWSG
jgi:glutamate-1-semialdehyde 2,1-aminomutase